MSGKQTVMVLALLAACGSAPAAQQMRIAFGGYTNRTETLTNFPVLVALSNNVGNSTFDFSGFVSANGYDLRFVTNLTDTTSLNYEIESWNTNAGQASYVWVQAPAIPGNGSGAIWARWGGDSTQLPCTTNGAIWDPSIYKNVYHLNENGHPYRDSAGGNNSASTTTDPSRIAGQIGSGQRFNGSTTNYINYGSAGATPTNVFSLSAWFNVSVWNGSGSANARAISQNVDGNTVFQLDLGTGSSMTDSAFTFVSYRGGTEHTIRTPTGYATNVWYFVTGTFDGSSTSKIYVNGALPVQTTDTGFGKGNVDNKLWMGLRNDASGAFNGALDEIRISPVVLSSNWIWACYLNQASNTLFNNYGLAGLAGGPTIQNQPVSNVTTNGATCNGFLANTGASATAVCVLWGEQNGGQTWNWANTNWWPDGTAWTNNSYPSTNLSFASNKAYWYTFGATNATTNMVAGSPVFFITGTVTLQATDPSASWKSGDTGTFGIFRPPDTTNGDLAVSYTIGGTAGNGVDYTTIGTSATISNGQTNATITITPIINAAPGGSKTVVLTLAPGLGTYPIGTPSNDTVTIQQLANTYYVAANVTSVWPFISWGTAATNIQDAVALATNGDMVLVSNGVYQVTNQVTISQGIVLSGFPSRAGTVIAGTWNRKTWSVINVNHPAALVCSLTVSNGSGDQLVGGGICLNQGTVSNVLVTQSAGIGSGSGGGGIYMTGGLLVNSIISDCGAGGSGASAGGGGLYQAGGEAVGLTIRNIGTNPTFATQWGAVRLQGGVLRRSVVMNNSGSSVAGIYLAGGRVENCLVASNSATGAGSIGGVYQTAGALVHVTVADNQTIVNGAAGGIYTTGGAVTNCIAWGNWRDVLVNNFPAGGDTYARFSCASELTVTNGNKHSNPVFTTVNGVPYQLSPGSPCIDVGTNLAGIVTDLAGTNRVIDGDGNGMAIADMGAYEAPVLADGVFTARIEALSGTTGFSPLPVVLKACPVGTNTDITWYGWDLDGNGAPEVSGPGLGQITNTFTLGRYTIGLWVTNSAGFGATAVVSNLVSVIGTNIYVSNNGGCNYPYETLPRATTNLLEALNMALTGCTVFVDSGTYSMPVARYEITGPMTVRGLGAREATVIKGEGTRIPRSVLTASHAQALICSLTVSNGSGDQSIGGAICLNQGTVSNVVVMRSETIGSGAYGGGITVTGGLLVDSVIRDCGTDVGGGGLYITGGQAVGLTVSNNGTFRTTKYGAVYMTAGALRRSVIVKNTATLTGGIYLTGGLVENCLVVSNAATAASSVGGVWQAGGQLVNVTVATNSCPASGTVGGIYTTAGGVTNSIAWGNLLGSGASDFPAGNTYGRYSCASELSPGAPNNNINRNPSFKNAAAGNYHLANGSPCFGAGTNFTGISTLDLDRQPRVRRGGAVDMGAYEALPPAGTVITIR